MVEVYRMHPDEGARAIRISRTHRPNRLHSARTDAADALV